MFPQSISTSQCGASVSNGGGPGVACGLLSSGVEGGSDAVDGGMDTGLEALLDDMMS